MVICYSSPHGPRLCMCLCVCDKETKREGKKMDWLDNFWVPMQNENAYLLQKLLRISRQQHQTIKQSMGALWDCTGRVFKNLALVWDYDDCDQCSKSNCSKQEYYTKTYRCKINLSGLYHTALPVFFFSSKKIISS